MTVHPDILEEPESLKKPFFFALVLHFGAVLLIAAATLRANRTANLFGSLNPFAGGSVAITPVKSIPLPSRGPENLVANDTESQVPAPSKPQPKPAVREDNRDAIALRGREQKAPKQRSPEPVNISRYKQPGTDQPNQVYSSTGAAAANPMYAAPGSGGVGIGVGSPFSGQFGYYADLVKQRVAQNWRTQEVDARLQTAPMVIVTFVIERNGSVFPNSVSVMQRSGNLALDTSCQRAILDAAPFPPLPAGFPQNSATVEFRFQLKR